MKIKFALPARTFIIALAFMVSACMPLVSAPTPPVAVTPLQHSMKGYELYSWQEGNQWRFTLLTGTNRAKSLDEIMGTGSTVTADGWVQISVLGVDSIQNVLSRLPPQEEIFWLDRYWSGQAQVQAAPIALPPQAIIDAVQYHCTRLGLALHVSSIGTENRQ